ncbi:hypothetical protein [Pusillimonas sp.]|uniref:hypothetical protein n=1 Tax=Pusillimonas sp. TaxID=3040095 RepID=UPI0037C56BC4
MRERLDCALIGTACTESWMRPWAGRHWAGRLYFHSPIPSIDVTRPGASGYLADGSMLLRRFDVCLVPVSQDNLAWARTSLLAANGRLTTPVFALIGQLKAAALNDLYELGLSDFVRTPLCPEELRVRIERLLDERRAPALSWAAPAAAVPSKVGERGGEYICRDSGKPVGEAELCSTILERTGIELDAYAAATASRSATSRESFRAAKGKIIERFETAYIKAALGRHSGNIAMAARAAQKHRRAFWALMRKYDIDAAPYRSESPPKSTSGG